MINKTPLTGVERFFDPGEIIVSKTDTKGIITYANRTFMRMAGYSKDELIGTPHNILRHEDMPRCAFKLVWDTIESGKECFAYVVNKCKNGDHYWVFAHITPSFDPEGRIVGYHSTRRVPERRIVQQIIAPLYADLLAIEKRHSDPKAGMAASFDAFVKLLTEKGVGYDELVFSL